MNTDIFQVDAFTKQAFAGNPAAVCLLTEAREAGWMQNVAREMNLSETAFVARQAEGFDLRWFTPVVEVELCGHATLASAHVLWENGWLAETETIRFHTRSGLLTAQRGSDGGIELNFPARPEETVEPPAGLLDALGVKASYVGRSRRSYLVEVDNEETVRQLQPDITRLGQICRSVMVTSRASTPGYDFVSRYFAPGVGVAEDPVTGSAHCCLGPYWGKRLGRHTLVAYQASARGGIVRVRLDGDRVWLGGQAVTVMKGVLLC